MFIGVLGLNHRTAPVELREQLAFSREELAVALRRVKEELHIPECVILSTCNRVELYTVLPELDGNEARLKQFLAYFHKLDPGFVGDRFYWYLQPDSVRHLFRVAAGLESMVVGESEIQGQVKEAYEIAASLDCVGRVFHPLFQASLRTGKEVRAKTRIGQGAISVSSVAVELARKIFKDLTTKTILLMGTGQMGEATLQSLKGQGAGKILVANRSTERAIPLAKAVGGQVIRLPDLETALVEADMVICSTAADDYLLTQSQIRQIYAQRQDRPLCFIDISVPRNLDPRIADLEGVYLYDIDDLEGIASANRRMRLNEVTTCAAIIEAQLQGFLGRLAQTPLVAS